MPQGIGPCPAGAHGRSAGQGLGRIDAQSCAARAGSADGGWKTASPTAAGQRRQRPRQAAGHYEMRRGPRSGMDFRWPSSVPTRSTVRA